MKNTDIGIIGGADGPTSIVISSQRLAWYEIAAIALAIIIIAYIVICAIRKNRNR
ncbi:MAG: sodium ion-translocating decarboxylase subunit beta [Clostridiales bacterium]|nr:sodium ion-translocating decarboxylase subunit beta [Clostridiales bacterium]